MTTPTPDTQAAIEAVRRALEAGPTPGAGAPPEQEVFERIANWMVANRWKREGHYFIQRDGSQVIHAGMIAAIIDHLAATQARAPQADETLLLQFLHDLHANVPEADRPSSWSDFSDEQAARARAAWSKLLAALPSHPQDAAPEGNHHG